MANDPIPTPLPAGLPTPKPMPTPAPVASVSAAAPGATPKPAEAEQATVDELPGSAAVQLTLWQHPFVQNALPILTSLMLHAGVIILGLALLEGGKAVKKLILKDQVIIPEATMTQGQEGGIPHPGLGGDPNRDAAQDKFPDVPPDAQGLSDKPNKDLTSALQGGGSGDSSDNLIGPSLAGGMMGRGKGTGSGSGDGLGSGGDGGALAPFGVPGGGGGIGPKASFVGVSGNARKVAFICDASGSMIQKFDTLRVELRKAVDGLRPPQSFNIIFFQERDKSLPLDANAMLFASPENKRKSAEFLDRTAPHGETNPIPALELAFKQGAQLIFLLTDGDFPDNAAVIKRCKELNPGAKVKINTIIFVGNKQEMDEAKSFIDVMKTIANDSGGLFKLADANQLQ